MLEKISVDITLTQTQKKELSKLKRQKEKWKLEYDTSADIKKLEEDKLKSLNPDKELSEIYGDMGFEAKEDRAFEEEEEEDDTLSIADIKGRGLQNKKNLFVTDRTSRYFC